MEKAKASVVITRTFERRLRRPAPRRRGEAGKELGD
jgi:hypothetical protein